MRTLIAVAIAAVVAIAARAAVNPESVVGIWLFDEGSGGTAADSSGNGNDGELLDAVWADGVRGGAVEFDGVSRVEIAASAGTNDYLDGFTYMLWVDVVSAGGANIRVMERDWHNPTIQAGGADFYGSIVTGRTTSTTASAGACMRRASSCTSLSPTTARRSSSMSLARQSPNRTSANPH